MGSVCTGTLELGCTRPFKEGAWYTLRACAGVSIAATGCITIVIVRRFCMTYSSMDDKRRVYNSIRLPHNFLGSPGACTCNVYQALSPPPPLEGPGNEAISSPDPISKEEKGLVKLGRILGPALRNFHTPMRSQLWLSHMTSLPQECNITV